MFTNPYHFKGTLDPLHQYLVCIERKEIVDQVKKGVASGEYWAIFGPRQIGKSTFLKQLKFKFDEAHYLYFDFTICPKEKLQFYYWFQKEIIKNVSVPESENSLIKKEKLGEPELDFFNFLMAIKLKFRDEKKIAFLFDEIEAIPFLSDFLNVWRRIYHETFVNRKYSVVITGSFDLVKVTLGKTSPFNIARRGYLTDFSDEESALLIDRPFKTAGLKIDPKAREELIYKTGGHPQILQEACFKLFEIASKEKREITELEVKNEIDQLFLYNDSFNLLRISVEKNKILENLLISMILKKEKSQYLPYSEFRLNDSGPIIKDEDGYCKIRNPLFEEFLKGILENRVDSTNHLIEQIPQRSEIHNVYQKKSKKKNVFQIFIAYSHYDLAWKNELVFFLKNLEIHGVKILDDGGIPVGENFDKDLEEKIDNSDIAIFLVSHYSLGSAYIINKEIPRILKRWKSKELIFYPILISQCPWEINPYLKDLEIRPKGKKPLTLFKKKQIAGIFTEITLEIYSQLKLDNQIPLYNCKNLYSIKENIKN